MQTAIRYTCPECVRNFELRPRQPSTFCFPFALLSYVRSPTISSAMTEAKGPDASLTIGLYFHLSRPSDGRRISLTHHFLFWTMPL